MTHASCCLSAFGTPAPQERQRRVQPVCKKKKTRSSTFSLPLAIFSFSGLCPVSFFFFFFFFSLRTNAHSGKRREERTCSRSASSLDANVHIPEDGSRKEAKKKECRNGASEVQEPRLFFFHRPDDPPQTPKRAEREREEREEKGKVAARCLPRGQTQNDSLSVTLTSSFPVFLPRVRVSTERVGTGKRKKGVSQGSRDAFGLRHRGRNSGEGGWIARKEKKKKKKEMRNREERL